MIVVFIRDRCLCLELDRHVDSMSAFENFPGITPFLWFDSNAEEAVEFHLTIFKNSGRLDELHNGGVAVGPTAYLRSPLSSTARRLLRSMRPVVQVHRSSLISRAVRCAGGGGLLLGEVDCRRERESVRLAQGQVRTLLADCARAPARPHQENRRRCRPCFR